MRRLVIALAAALMLAGCEAPVDMVAVADKAVAQFHARLDADQVAAIKADADPGQAIASDRAVAMLNAQRIRLGKVIAARRTAMKDDYGSKGRTVAMTYNTTYADGTVAEDFIFHITEGKAVLVSYSALATDNAVTAFHRNLDAAAFDAIAAATGGEMKGSEDKLRAILADVHTKMGTVKSTRCATFNARMDGAVRRVELTYETQFANGREIEEFVFHIQPDGTALLAGYFIKPVEK